MPPCKAPDMVVVKLSRCAFCPHAGCSQDREPAGAEDTGQVTNSLAGADREAAGQHRATQGCQHTDDGACSWAVHAALPHGQFMSLKHNPCRLVDGCRHIIRRERHGDGGEDYGRHGQGKDKCRKDEFNFETQP